MSKNFRWLQQHLTRIFSRARLKVVVPTCFLWALLFTVTWEASYITLFGRLQFVGLAALFTFGIFEVWPKRLPKWIARWALQVFMVAATIPLAVAFAYTMTTLGLDPPWWQDNKRLSGFGTFTFFGLLFAPWIAVAALLNQIKEEARNQALAFELERSEYERKALDARLRLLQSQVEPHFLFNTLANVRELVATGSSRAAPVLESLIAYLRAAVPRLHQPSTTMAQELELVRAYLEVMHMRMPDRLQFDVVADDVAKAAICPPMTLLTLVENAVRHGIDPSEEGGRVDVKVYAVADRILAQVSDTGVGLSQHQPGLGTGLANVRERLRLVFGDSATLTLTPNQPRGVRAAIDLPLNPNGNLI
jgi:signal transduction histidine kinase